MVENLHVNQRFQLTNPIVMLSLSELVKEMGDFTNFTEKNLYIPSTFSFKTLYLIIIYVGIYIILYRYIFTNIYV